jgi:GNAT superfamily N-acetyltransferase
LTTNAPPDPPADPETLTARYWHARGLFDGAHQAFQASPSDDTARRTTRGAWGISCFVTKAGCRRQGIATALLAGAVDWARKNGARVLDACPVDGSANRPPISLYPGLASTFRRAGFREVARRRPDRPLMRLELNG